MLFCQRKKAPSARVGFAGGAILPFNPPVGQARSSR